MGDYERPLKRQYPPFGDLPSAVGGVSELRFDSANATISLSGFAASPYGIAATLRAAARVSEASPVVYAFAEHRPVENAVDVWVVSDEANGIEGNRTYAQLVSGGGGVEGDVHAASFNLWFPIEPAVLESDLVFEIVWSGSEERVTTILPRLALQNAAERADTRFVGR